MARWSSGRGQGGLTVQRVEGKAGRQCRGYKERVEDLSGEQGHQERE